MKKKEIIFGSTQRAEEKINPHELMLQMAKKTNIVAIRNKIVKEKEQLDKNISKLSVFVIGVHFMGLSRNQRTAMYSQLRAMNEYSQALRDRIIDITSQESE